MAQCALLTFLFIFLTIGTPPLGGGLIVDFKLGALTGASGRTDERRPSATAGGEPPVRAKRRPTQRESRTDDRTPPRQRLRGGEREGWGLWGHPSQK